MNCADVVSSVVTVCNRCSMPGCAAVSQCAELAIVHTLLICLGACLSPELITIDGDASEPGFSF